MRRAFFTVAITMMALAAAAASAAAQTTYLPLEDRVGASEVVVTGEVTTVGPEDPNVPGIVSVTIAVTQVLKGQDDLKQVTMLCERQVVAPADATPDAPTPEPAEPQAQSFPYKAGQKRVWFLNKHDGAQNMFTDLTPHQPEPIESASTAAAVVAGLKNPEAALANDKESPRSRLAAAYAVCTRALPEARLPVVDGKPNTTGAKPIPAASILAAGKVAAEFFSATVANDRIPAETVLKRLECPTATLAPPVSQPKSGRTAEEVLRDINERRTVWGRSIATWVDENLKDARFYLMPGPAKAATIVIPPSTPATPTEPKPKTPVKAPPATGKIGDMKVGQWAPLFADADWNKFPESEVREFSGTLIEAAPADAAAPAGEQRKNLYRLKMADRTWDVYTAGSNALAPYAGRIVTLRGKYMLLVLEARTSREIWPTAIRLDK